MMSKSTGNNKVEISEVCKIVGGGTPSTKVDEYFEGEVAWLTPADLTDYKKKHISEGRRNLTKAGLNNSSAKLLPKGSVLFSSRAPIGYVAISEKPLATNQGFRSLIPNDKLNNEYLYYFLKSAKHEAEKLASGTTFKEISGKNLGKLKIPVPSLPTQHRIVEKIEELFSELDNGVENLKKAQQQLKTYRQAVLKDAFEGKLTKAWRVQQDDLPTPEELLEQIKSERKAHRERELFEWEQEVEQWEKDGKPGRKPRKPRKALNLDPFTKEELAELDNLPDAWRWVKIDKIIDHAQYALKAGPFGSALKKEFYVDDGYKVYGQEQVIGGSENIGDYYVDEEKYQELLSCKVSPKDVLISLVGTVGKVLILSEDVQPGVINPRLVKISVNEDFYKPEFFKYFFESAYLKSLYATKAHGATMDILNSTIIKDLPFPFLSKQEQEKVLDEIESRLSVVDQLEQTIKENLQKAEALRQSILKKAFGGKLVDEFNS